MIFDAYNNISNYITNKYYQLKKHPQYNTWGKYLIYGFVAWQIIKVGAITYSTIKLMNKKKDNIENIIEDKHSNNISNILEK